MVGLLGTRPTLLFLGALACSLGLFALYPNRSQGLVFLITGIAGSVAEITAIQMGAWQYTDPAFMGIPLWLPLVWGSAGMYISILSKKLG